MTDTQDDAFQRGVAKGMFNGLVGGRPDAVVTLPFPVSVHKAFRRHNGKHLSAEYRQWRDEAGWMLKQQKPPKVAGRVTVIIDLVAPDKRRRDGDNYKKGPLDLLVAHGLIEADDNRIVRQSMVRWLDQGAPCTVSIHRASEG